ncbi:hypothetical protein [Rickettsia endosymbiont of Ceutorhynchus obstrictus]|uniref:hypothetical protein n=1 Tax=Rickettsia endosymbiont of Ceutorhynchus obstrictus TaxID=3066249 RepID=UPI003132F404
MAAAIQAIPNVMRDLIRILNKFSIKICLTGLPRRHKCLLAMTIPVAMQQRRRDHGMTPFCALKSIHTTPLLCTMNVIGKYL